jgi:site-specific DNA-cytosine methylase
MTTQVLELFAGIGGVATALGCQRIAASLDISTDAKLVYGANFQTPYFVREIDSVSDLQLSQWSSHFWWMSPPCQPYSRRGNQRDRGDRRAFALQRVLDGIRFCRPPSLGLENVQGFEGSQAHSRLIQCLDELGYCRQSIRLCPTEMGWPNRRPRYYLIASHRQLAPWKPLPQYRISWEDFLLPISGGSENEHLWISDSAISKFECALDLMMPGFERATACFAGSYGKTWLHAGSYLSTDCGVRRFAPREVARFLGFPDSFALPALSASVSQSDRKLWKLLGNSLSIPCTTYVMQHALPEAQTLAR